MVPCFYLYFLMLHIFLVLANVAMSRDLLITLVSCVEVVL